MPKSGQEEIGNLNTSINVKKKKQQQTVLNLNIPDSHFTDALTEAGMSVATQSRVSYPGLAPEPVSNPACWAHCLPISTLTGTPDATTTPRLRSKPGRSSLAGLF